MMDIAFLIHLVTTAFMTGLIWMVQIVHYPLFKVINSNEFPQYENSHSKLITFIVGPIMTVELITGLLIAGSSLLSGINYRLFLISFGLLILIWLSTVIFQIPHHKKLSQQKDKDILQKLITYNWIRTISWSARSLILSYIIYNLL